MKKLFLFLMLAFCSLHSESKVSFINSNSFGNIDYNSLEFLRSSNINELMVAGVSAGSTNVSLNSSTSILINANSLQDVFWLNTSSDIQNTQHSDFIEGTAYDFIQDMEIIRNGSYKAMYGANFGAGTVNAPIGPPLTFGNLGSIVFGTDFSDVVTAMIVLQATLNCGVTQTKPAQSNWLVSGSYGGSMNLGASTFTSTGTRDGFIGSWNPGSGNSNWFGEIKAFGHNSIDRIYYNENTNEVLATGQLNSSGTYSVNGVSTNLNTSPLGNTVFLLRLNASTGSYIDHNIFGSGSNINPFGLLETTTGVFFAGSMNDDVYPDANDLSKVAYSHGLADQLILKFDAGFTYQSNRVFGSTEVDFGKSFRKFSSTSNTSMALTGAYTFSAGPVINQQASVFFIDESLNVLDSIVFGGKGYDSANDIDMDSLGFLYIAGNFSDTADMDPGPATFNIIGSGGYDAYISRFDASTLGFYPVNSNSYLMQVYPNPSSDFVEVELSFAKPDGGKIKLLDMMGRVLKEVDFSSQKNFLHEFDISNMQQGIYFIKVESESANESRKIIVG